MKKYSIPAYRVSLVRDNSIKIDERPQITSAASAYNILRDWFLDHDRESFVILMLSAKAKVIGIHTVSTGSLTASVVHPREVMKPLILHNAASVILAHNHPSGDPAPSLEDLQITRRLRQAGDIMGIRVLDHIIVGEDCFHSMAERGNWE